MNELSTTEKHQLPQTIEEKTAFVLFGSDALNAYRKKLKAIQSKYGISSEQYKQIQLEAQGTAENLLLFSVDIGKEMQKIDKAEGARTDLQPRDVDDKRLKTKTETIHDMGFTDRQARDFQTLANHEKTVQKAIEDARKEDRIVTRQDVLNRIAEPTKSKHQFMKDFKQQVREEHRNFEESDDKVVSIADIQRDKRNTEIIALDVSTAITRALSGVGNLGMIKKDEFALMTNSLKPQAKADMINRARESINILSNLINMLGGKE